MEINEQAPLLRTSETDLYNERELEKAHPDRWSIIPSLWCGAFLAALDSTVVASTYAVMGSELGSLSKASWIATGYLLSSTALQPLYGGLSDIFGRRNALLWANSLFLVGSAGCVMSRSLPQLVMARAVAGLGGAGLGTLSSIVVSDLVPLRNRSTYNGFANLVFGCGQVIGAPLGGYLADTCGWRFAFLIQVPVTLISIIIIYWKVDIPVSSRNKHLKLKDVDFLGSGLLIVAITTLLVVVQIAGDSISLISPVTIGLSFLSISTLAAFFHTESIVENPIVTLKVVFSRNPLLSGLTNMFGYMGSFSLMFNVPLLLQVVVGESASQSGFKLISNVIGMCCGSLLAGFIIKKSQNYYYVLIVGAFIEIFGSILVSSMNESTSLWKLQTCLYPSGLGHGLVLSASLMAVISSVTKDEQAKATSVSYLFRVFGSAFGVAFTSAINSYFLRKDLKVAFDKIDNRDELISKIIKSVTYIKKLEPSLQELTKHLYYLVIRKTLLITIVMYVISTCFALFVKQYPLDRKR